jgi:uncharacterized coiled-coil protein SlyX
MSNDDSTRLNELEVRYTYLERAVRDLDQVVIDLRAQVDRLERELRRVIDHAKDTGSSPEHEKPPHY